MPWEKGQSGNPGANGKGKPWRDALHKALKERDPKTGEHKLYLVARACVKSALGGDITAMKEIGDRVDGKSAQQIAVTGADDAPPVKQEIMFGWMGSESNGAK